jgi:hypothetical protein
MIMQVGLLGIGFALATGLFGWWSVPLLGCLWGMFEEARSKPAVVAALAAGLGWLLLLIWDAVVGPLLLLSARASGVMGVPSATLIALTLLYPMALAWGAGIIGETMKLILGTWRRE